MLCVVIPTLNCADHLSERLSQLAGSERVVVADGGSSDGTLNVALQGAVLGVGARGRGQQLTLGARHSADTTWFLFIHADNKLPDEWSLAVKLHMKKYPNSAGYFRYRADAKGFWPRFIDFWVGMRCQWWGLPYGDQGLLISKSMYEALGGYPEQSLFEDVALIDSLKKRFGRTSLRPLKGHMLIDVSKYDAEGIWTRGRKNLRLLKAYRRGEDVETLAQLYRSSS